MCVFIISTYVTCLPPLVSIPYIILYQLLLQGFYLTVVLLLGVPVTEVMGFSSGAPSGACSTISPDPTRHGANPQTSAVPYTVNISSLANGYVPGQSYTSKYS